MDIFDPFEEMIRLRKLMERMMREFTFEEYKPSTDIYEEDGEIVIKMDMPGVDKKNINLIVDEDRIEVKAQQIKEAEKRKKNFLRRERSYAGYYQALTLPVRIDPSTAKARYQNGVLEIRAKKKKIKGKRITIQ